MAVTFPAYRPALRVVDSVGGVLYGPTPLYQPDSAALGITTARTRVEYVPELLGEWLSYSYRYRWRKLGYRPSVTLSFALLESDPARIGYGLSLIYGYYTAALASETYAALQFNLYSLTSTDWRGMMPKSSWNPSPAQGKQAHGHELELSLTATDLIATPGDWTLSQW